MASQLSNADFRFYLENQDFPSHAENPPVSSRLPSDQDTGVPSGMHTPVPSTHVEFSSEDLARVPSYSTALQSRPNHSLDNSLPTYQSAISRSE